MQPLDLGGRSMLDPAGFKAQKFWLLKVIWSTENSAKRVCYNIKPKRYKDICKIKCCVQIYLLKSVIYNYI